MKKLSPKKSVDLPELRRLGGATQQRPARPQCNAKITPRCDECRFVGEPDSKLRFIRTVDRRIICEVCFEKLNISEWEFIRR